MERLSYGEPGIDGRWSIQLENAPITLQHLYERISKDISSAMSRELNPRPTVYVPLSSRQS